MRSELWNLDPAFPQTLVIFVASQEYSMISQSGRRANVRVFVQVLVKVLGSSMVTS